MKNIEAMILYEKLTKGLENCTVGFPVEINSARRKNIRLLKPIVEDYNVLKNELITRFGAPNEDGQVSVSLANKEFMAEFTKLNAIENDIQLHTFDESLIPGGLTTKEYDILAELSFEVVND